MGRDGLVKSSGEIDVWDAAVGALCDEWELVVERQRRKRRDVRGQLVEAWEQHMGEMTRDYDDLVRGGHWHRGPADVFSILGLARREIYHSAMLAWLFDPLGAHGLGTSFLDAFLQCCGLDYRGGNIVEVRCEEVGPGLECRADIVIRSENWVVVIENKLDAYEGDDQCGRLFRAFSGGDNVRFVFLSPSGRAAQTASGEARGAFIALGYKNVRNALEAVLADVGDAKQSPGRPSVFNYLSTLKKEFP